MLINGDPLNPSNWREPYELRALGFSGVRIVSRPGLENVVVDCQAASLYVLAVVSKESQGYLLPGADCYQIGNEPDIGGTLDYFPNPADFAGELQIYRGTYPKVAMITGGLAAADPVYLRKVRDAGGLNGFQGVGLHYPATVTTITAFQKYASGLPICVTEWNVPALDVPFYRAKMRGAGVAFDAYFCIGYGQFVLTAAHERALQV